MRRQVHSDILPDSVGGDVADNNYSAGGEVTRGQLQTVQIFEPVLEIPGWQTAGINYLLLSIIRLIILVVLKTY